MIDFYRFNSRGSKQRKLFLFWKDFGDFILFEKS